MQSEITTAPEQERQLTDPILLTDAAASKVRELMEREEQEGLSLRVAVQPGGCSGMRYALFFDDRELDGDVAFEVQGVSVRLDQMSAPYLRGTKIDWVDSLQGAGFSIENPNAQSACACGDSFS
ncbi:MAG: iron-sulfur cluster insertion protein ErpA [Actinobacteria bacterium QS_8_72_14]|jgi:iron-sulfur cluster assembly accessory protein|nr:MAG: iron-sulfur cluster insertion protein ErpA [Actinobacteria bacterium QS_8_72_14]